MSQEPNFDALSKRVQAAPVKAQPPNSDPDFEDLNRVVQSAPQVAPPEERSIGGFASNLIPSFGKFVGSAVEGLGNVAMHPIDTVSNILQAGGQGIEKGMKAIAPGTFNKPADTSMFDSVLDKLKERYGSWGNIKKTAYEDPFGMAADAAVLMGGAGGALKMVPKLGGLGSVISKAGLYADPIQGPLKLTGKVLSGGGKLGSALLPKTEAIRQAFAEHSSEFTKALYGETSMADILDSAKNAFQEVSKKRADFGSKLADIGTKLGEDTKLNAQKALADGFGKHAIGVNVSFPAREAQDILNGVKLQTVRLTDSEDIFRVISEKKLPNGSKLPKGARVAPNFSQSAIRHNAGDMSRVNDVLKDMLRIEKDTSAVNFDRLRQGIFDRIPKAVRDLEGAVPVENAASDILKSTHDALQDSLMTEVPRYGELVRSYKDSTRFLNEVKTDLMGGSNGASINRLKNAAAEGESYQKMLIETLDTKTGSKLRDQLGGYALKELKPSFKGIGGTAAPILFGIMRGLHPITLVALGMSSPRIAGEVASVAGKASRVAGKVTPYITAPIYRPPSYLPQNSPGIRSNPQTPVTQQPQIEQPQEQPEAELEPPVSAFIFGDTMIHKFRNPNTGKEERWKLEDGKPVKVY